MAALNRPSKATYEVHESVKVDTLDNEDHTFSGIMFPIKAKEVLPVESIVIHSVAVRGHLGKMSVWITNEDEAPNANGEYHIRLSARHWTKIYEKEHAPSPRTYSVMKFDAPVVMTPGSIRAMYIHSTLDGDEAIVYDNSRGLGMVNDRLQRRPRYEDAMISIMSGKAHLSNQPFGQVPVWGWGTAWRDHREFVGQLEYGAVYKLWQPDLNVRYGDKFRRAALRLLACQRRAGSPVAVLPDECILYIINMCRWDWFDDTSAEMKVRRRILKGRRRMLELERQEQERLRMERERQAAAQAASERRAAAAADAASHRTCKKKAAVCAAALGRQQDTSYDAEVEQDSDDDIDDEEDDDDDDDDYDSAAAANGQVADSDSNSGDDAALLAADAGFGEDDDDDDDDEEEEEEDNDESDWERANGYRADGTVFHVRDYSSDEEEFRGLDAARNGDERQDWFRRNLARVHILRSLVGAAAAPPNNP